MFARKRETFTSANSMLCLLSDCRALKPPLLQTLLLCDVTSSLANPAPLFRAFSQTAAPAAVSGCLVNVGPTLLPRQLTYPVTFFHYSSAAARGSFTLICAFLLSSSSQSLIIRAQDMKSSLLPRQITALRASFSAVPWPGGGSLVPVS